MLQRRKVLAEFTDPTALAELRDCLRIVEDPGTCFHCRCIGEEAIELYSDTRALATIGLHHGHTIRWELWTGDATLEDGRRLLTFLAERGVPEPLNRYEQMRRVVEDYKRAADRWQEAMPSCLRPFWSEMNNLDSLLDGEVAPRHRAIETSLPDPLERALLLFQWFGSGAGAWNEFPSYEEVAERLLLEEPTERLVAALTRAPDTLTERHLEGAARYFASWRFREKKRDEVRLLPRDLCRRLLAYCLTSADAAKVELARHAFTE